MPFNSQDGDKNCYKHPNGLLFHGNCIEVMKSLPSQSIDFMLTDPPYLVNYKPRDGRTITNDHNSDWLLPAFREAFRLLKPNTLAVSFYGWSKCDRFLKSWKQVGFRPVGHLVFTKSYSSQSKRSFLAYSHECAFLLAKLEFRLNGRGGS